MSLQSHGSGTVIILLEEGKSRAYRLFRETGIQSPNSAAKRVATNAPYPIVWKLHHMHAPISEVTPFKISSFQELHSVPRQRKHCTNVFRTVDNNCWIYSLSFQVSAFCLNVWMSQEEPRAVQYLVSVLSSFQKGYSGKDLIF